MNAAELVYCTELVLNKEKNMVEQQIRLPGENQVDFKYNNIVHLFTYFSQCCPCSKPFPVHYTVYLINSPVCTIFADRYGSLEDISKDTRIS